ncbi:hypothetical protein YTPLAS18_00720 [Nitrospira sp.]|nr:hypothetical protein YTPLAS18_00720 [Nitrospira sp.]
MGLDVIEQARANEKYQADPGEEVLFCVENIDQVLKRPQEPQHDSGGLASDVLSELAGTM